MEPTKVYVDQRDIRESPNVSGVRHCVLKEGKRIRRVAKLTHVRDQHTGEHHHNSLAIRTYALTKAACTFDLARSLNLDGTETERLTAFLGSTESEAVPVQTGGYLVVPTRGASDAATAALRDLTAPDRLDALSMLLREAAAKPEVLGEMVARLAADDGYLERAAAALNLALYRRVLERLQEMIQDPDTSEGQFQTLLKANPWLFGSAYSAILNRRRWTRDEITDFVLRRSTDGWVEIIEIKTPLSGQALFGRDRSHKTLFAGAELSKVTAQVQNYLEHLDRSRDGILANDGVDVTKTRALIIVGLDGELDQQQALRRYNSHLHRIEVITFDGLLAIASQVLRYLEVGQEGGEATRPEAYE